MLVACKPMPISLNARDLHGRLCALNTKQEKQIEHKLNRTEKSRGYRRQTHLSITRMNYMNLIQCKTCSIQMKLDLQDLNRY